jgi:hypothetical protein
VWQESNVASKVAVDFILGSSCRTALHSTSLPFFLNLFNEPTCSRGQASVRLLRSIGVFSVQIHQLSFGKYDNSSVQEWSVFSEVKLYREFWIPFALLPPSSLSSATSSASNLASVRPNPYPPRRPLTSYENYSSDLRRLHGPWISCTSTIMLDAALIAIKPIKKCRVQRWKTGSFGYHIQFVRASIPVRSKIDTYTFFSFGLGLARWPSIFFIFLTNFN